MCLPTYNPLSGPGSALSPYRVASCPAYRMHECRIAASQVCAAPSQQHDVYSYCFYKGTCVLKWRIITFDDAEHFFRRVV